MVRREGEVLQSVQIKMTLRHRPYDVQHFQFDGYTSCLGIGQEPRTTLYKAELATSMVLQKDVSHATKSGSVSLQDGGEGWVERCEDWRAGKGFFYSGEGLLVVRSPSEGSLWAQQRA